MSKKPLLYTKERSEDEQFDPEYVEGIDPSYIPGYSEIIRANDLDKADALYFREQNGGRTKEHYFRNVIKAHPQELDYELGWQRVAGPVGTATYAANVQFANAKAMGWRIASVDDLTSRGIGFPPSATIEADGTIRRLDVALCIRSGKVARKWDAHNSAKAAAAANASLPDQLYAGNMTTDTIREETRETITVASKD